jgi:hypothetical protein
MVGGLRGNAAPDNVAEALQRRYLVNRFDVFSNAVSKDSHVLNSGSFQNDEPEYRSSVFERGGISNGQDQ